MNSTKTSPVSLQINLAPGDIRYANLLLLHQLKALAKQASEIVLTVDTKPSKGRFAEGWIENKDKLDRFLETIVASESKAKILKVDYREEAKREVANFFFGSDFIPDKDHRGGPFYAYFFGLFHCLHSLVFHLDSDMFLGGGSAVWLQEAVALFNTHADYFILSPLPGPPHPQELLQHQKVIEKAGHFMFQMDGMSTRIFLMDKSRFDEHKIKLFKPSIKSQLKALVEGNTNAELPEVLIRSYMKQNNLKRVDFLGSGDGLWSLHPPYRVPEFYTMLPQLIKDIESNSLPFSQKGFYDINNDVIDWTQAVKRIKANRWWKRMYKKFFHIKTI